MSDSVQESRDPLTEKVIGCAIEVHRILGPGLLESAYQRCLALELRKQGLIVETEVPMPVNYKGEVLDCGYRVDILVEKSLILELKAVEAILPIHQAQILTYLKLSGLRLGLLINFHQPRLIDGLKRFIR
ncbi:MAG: GxxExxY protein [Spartobacteria bacterium]|nr:GxxExxY protein [Spartobacteria bacterium]